MAWLKAAKDKAHDVYGRAVTQVNEVSEGGGETRRDKFRYVGNLLKDRAVNKAKYFHDAVIVSRHHAKHGGELATEQRGVMSFSRGADSARVEIWAAADLNANNLLSESPDAYCTLVVGTTGASWSSKVEKCQQVKTHIALRQRHPRWGAMCVLPIPPGQTDLEISVRVMGSYPISADKLLGEARLPIAGEPAGARTVRLLSGGFASLSIGWSWLSGKSTSEKELEARHQKQCDADTKNDSQSIGGVCVMSLDDDDVDNDDGWDIGDEYDAMGAGSFHAPSVQGAGSCFEEALNFWTGLATSNGDDLANRLAVMLFDWNKGRTSDESVALVNELLLQAPFGRVFNCDITTAGVLLEALSERLQVLCPTARSRVAGALLERLERLSADVPRVAEETLLLSLLLTAEGQVLVELKRLIDAGGQGRDLHHLIYTVLSNSETRSEVLDHFRTEAGNLKVKPAHVFSDIDNTVWVSSFTSAGMKFPQGPIPGAISLFNALGGPITFLSSLPPMWETKTRRMLVNDLGIAEAIVLPSSLQTVVKSLVQLGKAQKEMGEQTERLLAQFSELYPEARFVFFGSEKDIDFALAFMEAGNIENNQQGQDRAAFIHDGVTAEGIEPRTPAKRRIELSKKGVFVFDSFADAAAELFRIGYLDTAGLRCAARCCYDEFATVGVEDYRTLQIYEARREELTHALLTVNRALRTEGFLMESSYDIEVSTEPLRRLSSFLADSDIAAVDDNKVKDPTPQGSPQVATPQIDEAQWAP